MDELLTKIKNSHTALQTINIPAGKANLAILLDALDVLEECFVFVDAQKAKEAAKEAEKEGGADNA